MACDTSFRCSQKVLIMKVTFFSRAPLRLIDLWSKRSGLVNTYFYEQGYVNQYEETSCKIGVKWGCLGLGPGKQWHRIDSLLRPWLTGGIRYWHYGFLANQINKKLNKSFVSVRTLPSAPDGVTRWHRKSVWWWNIATRIEQERTGYASTVAWSCLCFASCLVVNIWSTQ